MEDKHFKYSASRNKYKTAQHSNNVKLQIKLQEVNFVQ